MWQKTEHEKEAPDAAGNRHAAEKIAEVMATLAQAGDNQELVREYLLVVLALAFIKGERSGLRAAREIMQSEPV